MKFNISAFTHVGTVRDSNQDHILINGQILNEGEINLTDQDYCICFVADGVGGNNAGDFASHFVLEKLNCESDLCSNNFKSTLHKINKELLSVSKTDIRLTGTATTLTGLVIKDDIFQVVHAGDSQMWLLRNDMFFQITRDQVLDEFEKNSPITSYFGGKEDYLNIYNELSIHESMDDDIFLICSDGLYKSLTHKIVKIILKTEKDLESKAQKILENCLISGADDNTSVILIHQII